MKNNINTVSETSISTYLPKLFVLALVVVAVADGVVQFPLNFPNSRTELSHHGIHLSQHNSVHTLVKTWH